jgi:hypothetical protein
VTPHPSDIHRVYAMERQDRNAPLFWCGEDVWHGLETTAKSKSIRRWLTPEEAVEAYDRYFLASGKKKPPAEPIDVGVRPGVLCECGKLIFRSEQQALKALITLWKTKSRVAHRQERRPYECSVTPGNWHMTKQEARGESTK